MTPETEQGALDLIWPVWINTHLIENALGQWDAIAQHAGEINQIHGHFWGMTQRFALDSAVLGLCKLYDESSKRYKKHTISELCGYLERNFSAEHINQLNYESLSSIGVVEAGADEVLLSFRQDELSVSKGKLLSAINTIMPSKAKGSPLERLFTYRNKVLAHQEQLEASTKESTKFLPSLEEMHKLNKQAASFCQFISNVFTDTAFVESVVSGRMATLNIIKRVLGKNFDDPAKTDRENYEEMNRFYRKGEL